MHSYTISQSQRFSWNWNTTTVQQHHIYTSEFKVPWPEVWWIVRSSINQLCLLMWRQISEEKVEVLFRATVHFIVISRIYDMWPGIWVNHTFNWKMFSISKYKNEKEKKKSSTFFWLFFQFSTASLHHHLRNRDWVGDNGKVRKLRTGSTWEWWDRMAATCVFFQSSVFIPKLGNHTLGGPKIQLLLGRYVLSSSMIWWQMGQTSWRLKNWPG